MEKCENCGVEVEKGTLIRDQKGDASQLRCEKCIVPDKKPRKPRKKKEAPVIAPAAQVVAERTEELTPPIDHVALRQDVEKWATDCGLGKVTVSGPQREDFPRHGFGYVFQVREISGKERMATARYTSLGKRSFWTLDGMITG